MLNPELNLLKILLNKEAYTKYKEYIDLKYLEDNHRELSFLFKTLISLHSELETDVSDAELEGLFFATYPDAKKDLYEPLFSALRELQISPEGGSLVLNQILLRKRSMALSDLAFQVAQGTKKKEDLDAFLSKMEEEPQDVSLPVEPINLDLENLLEHVYSEQGYRWRLNCLNKSLGSLRNGDFGFIFARPETGKTTFLSSEVSYFLENGAGPIVWFNNEEQDEKVVLRVYQSFFGATLDAILSNVKKYNEEFKRRTMGRFFFFDSTAIGKREIESIIKRIKPAIVIYDQIDKIRGFAADRDDLRLGGIYQWARELAKGSHAAIGVSQADGTAEGVRFLTMEHVANAKTSKQAEADFIIGIGKSHDDGQQYARYLSICKNKLFGDKDSIPDLRHGRLEVLINPEIARYDDIITYS